LLSLLLNLILPPLLNALLLNLRGLTLNHAFALKRSYFYPAYISIHRAR
jgi:hypothetical protein